MPIQISSLADGTALTAALVAGFSCEGWFPPGRYTVAMKMIDFFGNDTTTLVPVSIG
jgi:hypothetical protein